MSYPPIRYTAEKGALNCRFRPASNGPDYVTPADAATAVGPTSGFGTAYHYLGTGSNTDGEFGLYRVEMGAEATGPSTHFHRTISESFYVLDGRLSLFDGERWMVGEAGDFLHVPVGGLHAFRNESGAPVSMLMLFTPGAPREDYFEGLAELGDLTDDERRQFFLDHDSYFV